MSPRRLRGFLDGAELTDEDWAVVSRWCEGKPTPHHRSCRRRSRSACSRAGRIARTCATCERRSRVRLGRHMRTPASNSRCGLPRRWTCFEHLVVFSFRREDRAASALGDERGRPCFAD